MIPFVDSNGSCFFKFRISNNQKVEILAENNSSYFLKIKDKEMKMNKEKAKLLLYGAEKLN